MKTKNKSEFVWNMLRGSRLMFLISILAAGTTTAADMLTPQVIRLAVDNVIGNTEPDAGTWQAAVTSLLGGLQYLREKPWVLAAVVLGIAVIRVVSTYLFRVFDTKAAETFVKHIRDTAFTHIGKLPYSWHMKHHTGDIIQRCTSDIETLRSFVTEQLTSVFRIVLMIVLSLFFMLRMNPWLTLISFLPIPLILVSSLRFHHKIGEGFQKCDENEGILSAMAQENITGVRVVRAFGRERRERDRFEAHNEYYTGLWKSLSRVMSGYWSLQDLLCGLQVMMVVVVGAVFCIRDRLTAGAYIAFISYNSQLTEPVRLLGRIISEMSKAGVSIGRIREVVEADEETDRPECREGDPTGDICFNHVSFGYEPGKEILHDVSFTVKAGTTLGILGGTGSGKSTLIMLLERFYELPEGSGSITVGGTDIRDMKAAELRSRIGVVLQEPYLFSRSIADNIRIANPSLPDEELRLAAKDACLDKTVEGFPQGYDTFVGERGVTLSGGQKQRTAIARALAGKTPILIFDDSLSAVDTRTDAEIRRNLQRRFGTATILLISHRITTLSHADCILVLDDGRVAEIGTHEELLEKNGIYRKVYDIQTGKEADSCEE